MMIPRFVFFLCIVLAWRWGWSQTIVPVDWAALTRDSTVVVIGVGFPGNYWITYPDKMVGQSIRQTDGTILYELPNIGKYVAGNIVRVRIEDAIKKDGKIKAGDTVSIFAPGLSHIYALPPLLENQKYLLFLHPLQVNENGFSGTVVIKPGADPKTQRPFDPSTAYVVVGKNRGVVPIGAESSRILEAVETATRARDEDAELLDDLKGAFNGLVETVIYLLSTAGRW